MKKTVAVIFGGRTAEHDVSIITAFIPIITSLKASGQYEVIPVYITPEGKWYSDPAMEKLDFFKRPDYLSFLANKKQLQFSFDGGLKLIWPGIRPHVANIDIAFPAMHGTYGEDGTLMGLLRFANIPFVGCDLEASAIAMDKVLTKQATEPLGIPSTPYEWFTAADWLTSASDIRQRIARLEYPLFVKPVHLGSTIAITRVANPSELTNAVEVALHYDDKIIIEQGVQNLIEVTLPIIGNGDDLQFALVEQPIAQFFDFEEKYLKGGKKGGGGVNAQYSHIPAHIPPALMKTVQEMGRATYKAIGAGGIARIDFLIDGKAGRVYMNEVNLLPGSLYIHNWKQAGLSGVELVTRLIGLAEERHAQQKKIAFSYHSDILSRVNGPKLQG